MCKQKYRYFDANLVKRKYSDCDGCLIDNNGQPSLNIYEYILEVLQFSDCCGAEAANPCPACDDYFIDRNQFVSGPNQNMTGVENFDLNGLVICVLVNECGAVGLDKEYNKACLQKGCCEKEWHIPLYRLKVQKRKEGCGPKVEHGNLVSLYNLIKEIGNIYC